MLERPQGYNPYSDVRRIGARLTVNTNGESDVKPVCAIGTYHDEAWTYFSAAAFTDGDYETAAGTTKNPLPTGVYAANMSVSIQPRTGAYIKITLAQSNNFPLNRIQINVKTSSGKDFGKSYGSVSSNVVVLDSDEALSELKNETVIGYSLLLPGGVTVTEVETKRAEEDAIVLTQNGIESFTVQESADITGASFPARSLSCKVDNSSGLFDILNPDKHIGKKIKAEVAVDGNYINVGVFTISKIEGMANGTIAKITAQDDVLRMENVKTGLYSNNAVSLSTLISYGSGAVGGVTFDVAASSASAMVAPAMMTTVDTQRNCLKKLAQAARLSAIWTGRNNVVKIYPLTIDKTSSAYDCELCADDVLDYNGLSFGDKMDCVEVSGKSGSGNVIATAGTYSLGCNMATMSNDFIAQAEVSTIAQNFLKAKNHRVQVKIKTRCDPTLEIGDKVKLKGLSEEAIGIFVVVGNSIVFDGGISSTLDLVAPC